MNRPGAGCAMLGSDGRPSRAKPQALSGRTAPIARRWRLWRLAFLFDQVRFGRVQGHARGFCLGDSGGPRCPADQPGRTAGPISRAELVALLATGAD